MKTVFQLRRRALAALLSEHKVDALLITCPANWYYLTGFTGEAGALIVSRKGTTLVTDGRFMVQGREETSGVSILQQKNSLLESVVQFLRDSSLRRTGFDPGQLTVAQMRSLRRGKGGRVQWVAAAGVVESLRVRKDEGELAQMRRAAVLAGEIDRKSVV